MTTGAVRPPQTGHPWDELSATWPSACHRTHLEESSTRSAGKYWSLRTLQMLPTTTSAQRFHCQLWWSSTSTCRLLISSSARCRFCGGRTPAGQKRQVVRGGRWSDEEGGLRRQVAGQRRQVAGHMRKVAGQSTQVAGRATVQSADVSGFHFLHCLRRTTGLQQTFLDDLQQLRFTRNEKS